MKVLCMVLLYGSPHKAINPLKHRKRHIRNANFALYTIAMAQIKSCKIDLIKFATELNKITARFWIHIFNLT